MYKYVLIKWPHSQVVEEFLENLPKASEDIYEDTDEDDLCYFVENDLCYFVEENLTKEIFKDGIPED